MRRESKKTAKRRRDTSTARREYVDGAKLCQLCGMRAATECHEITRGPARQAALSCRAAWLAVCRKCHIDLDDYEEWPLERQCAAKLLADGDHFNLAAICELRGRPATAITLVDVAEYLRLKD